MKPWSHAALAVATMLAVSACGVAPTPTSSPSPTPTSQPAESSATYLDGTISVSLRAPFTIAQGERLTTQDVVITNLGDTARTLYYSGDVLGFEVVDGSEQLVWKHPEAYNQPLPRFELRPGESKEVSNLETGGPGSWDLRDRNGFPVEPGEYRIRGLVTIALDDSVINSTHVFETPWQTLTIAAAETPEYARSVVLELTAPAEATVGDAIPMDLHLVNEGESPVVYWWAGTNQVPRYYLEIYVLKEGEPIWSAIDAHGIEGGGDEILEPGEAVTLSSLFEGHGAPWTWDLYADCSEDKWRFVRCEEPVEPGAYTVKAVVNFSPPGVTGEHASLVLERTAITVEQPLVVREP